MVLETQILTAVIDYFNDNCGLFSPVSVGGTSPNNSGISAEIAPGHARSVYLDKGSLQRMPVLLLVRHQKHQTTMETAVTLAKATREADRVHEKIAGLSIGTAPEFVQRSGADFIYSLIVNIDYLT